MDGWIHAWSRSPEAFAFCPFAATVSFSHRSRPHIGRTTNLTCRQAPAHLQPCKKGPAFGHWAAAQGRPCGSGRGVPRLPWAPRNPPDDDGGGRAGKGKGKAPGALAREHRARTSERGASARSRSAARDTCNSGSVGLPDVFLLTSSARTLVGGDRGRTNLPADGDAPDRRDLRV